MKRYEAYLPQIMDEDMKLISEPIDVYGQNIYNGRCVRMGADGKPEDVKRYEGFLKTAIDWPVTPEVLYWDLNSYTNGIRSRCTLRKTVFSVVADG